MSSDDRRIDGSRVTSVQRFEAFLLEFQDMVYATALRLLGNPAEAEDVAQTVFLKAFEHFDTLDGHPTAPGWLKTVATRESLNHLTRYRNRMEQQGPQGPMGPTGWPDGRMAEWPEVETEALYRALEAALRALPPHQRVPIVLYHFDELPYDQIAARLRVSLSKVKSDIHRGRQALRVALEQVRS